MSISIMDAYLLDAPIATGPGLTPLQMHYLERMHTLVQMRRDLLDWPIKDPLPTRLVNRAIFAAYCACRSLGIDEEARRIINMP